MISVKAILLGILTLPVFFLSMPIFIYAWLLEWEKYLQEEKEKKLLDEVLIK